MSENKFTRAKGWFPESWAEFGETTNHFHHGGGLNLRGFSGYLAPLVQGTDTFFIYSGLSGASLNAELELRRLFPVKPVRIKDYISLSPYFFADAGIMEYKREGIKSRYAPLRWDAGVGTLFTVKQWGIFRKASPLSVRLDAPLVVSHAPYEEGSNFKFRWMIGFSRAF